MKLGFDTVTNSSRYDTFLILAQSYQAFSQTLLEKLALVTQRFDEFAYNTR